MEAPTPMTPAQRRELATLIRLAVQGRRAHFNAVARTRDPDRIVCAVPPDDGASDPPQPAH
ncbi:hypothetical protein [Specibacter cremeus]|uniref:hypothetical protein n=1 Tax=Specibacter cremeus TaxID=1629051 RepID=UPI000F78BF12|nr:hypothetical protein [Specibacter cremeus]